MEQDNILSIKLYFDNNGRLFVDNDIAINYLGVREAFHYLPGINSDEASRYCCINKNDLRLLISHKNPKIIIEEKLHINNINIYIIDNDYYLDKTTYIKLINIVPPDNNGIMISSQLLFRIDKIIYNYLKRWYSIKLIALNKEENKRI